MTLEESVATMENLWRKEEERLEDRLDRLAAVCLVVIGRFRSSNDVRLDPTAAAIEAVGMAWRLMKRIDEVVGSQLH